MVVAAAYVDEVTLNVIFGSGCARNTFFNLIIKGIERAWSLASLTLMLVFVQPFFLSMRKVIHIIAPDKTLDR